MALLSLGAGVAGAQTTTDVPDQGSTVAGGTPTELGQTPADPATDPAAADTTGEAAATDTTATDGASTRSSSAGRAPRLLVENVTPRQVYFAGKRPAEFHYKHTGAGTADLRIEAVKKGPGKVIQSWRKNNVPADQKQQLRWDGSRRGGGHIRKGRFFFRVETAGGQALARKRASGKREFLIRPAIFPVRGRHQYWDGWGAGRGHEGQDVGASCGTTLVAAEAGKVAYKGFNAGGWGYYIVINVRGQNHAELYAHMQGPASAGGRVKTGEKVGRVGATGSAYGCHLHFEYWKGHWPGGHATPRVTKRLHTWDKWS